jgi:hypothetical protein
MKLLLIWNSLSLSLSLKQVHIHAKELLQTVRLYNTVDRILPKRGFIVLHLLPYH